MSNENYVTCSCCHREFDFNHYECRTADKKICHYNNSLLIQVSICPYCGVANEGKSKYDYEEEYS